MHHHPMRWIMMVLQLFVLVQAAFRTIRFAAPANETTLYFVGSPSVSLAFVVRVAWELVVIVRTSNRRSFMPSTTLSARSIVTSLPRWIHSIELPQVLLGKLPLVLSFSLLVSRCVERIPCEVMELEGRIWWVRSSVRVWASLILSKIRSEKDNTSNLDLMNLFSASMRFISSIKTKLAICSISYCFL